MNYKKKKKKNQLWFELNSAYRNTGFKHKYRNTDLDITNIEIVALNNSSSREKKSEQRKNLNRF